MRVQLVFLAIFAIAFGKNVPIPRVDEEIATEFIECLRKALDGGLESAQIPDHNPLVIMRNLTFPIDIIGITGVLKLENFEIDNIVLVHVVNVVGSHPNETQVVYNVEFHYDDLTVKGDYTADLEIFTFPYTLSGTINLSMKDLTIPVTWDQDLTTRLLNAFILSLNSGSVEFTLQGLGEVIDTIVSDAISIALLDGLNNADFTAASEALTTRLNTLWLDEDSWFRIDAIYANCQAS